MTSAEQALDRGEVVHANQADRRDSDEAAIRNLYQALTQMPEQIDAAVYEALFEPDSDYVIFDGTHLRGISANIAVHQRLAGVNFRGAKLHGRMTSVRFVSADVAVIHAVGNLQLRFHRRPKPSRDSIQTIVLHKSNERWRVAAFHNSRIQRLSLLKRLVMKLAGG